MFLTHLGPSRSSLQASEFVSAWLTLFSHSTKTKFLWKEQTGKAMATYSHTRWEASGGHATAIGTIWRHKTIFDQKQ